MTPSGKYTPLGLNTLGSFIQNEGLNINLEASVYMGTSNAIDNYSPGTTVRESCLRLLSLAIREGYLAVSRGFNKYNQMLSIGYGIIPALGLSNPVTYTRTQSLSPYPANATPYTGEYASYGWLRLFPLQAHTEFYINNGSYTDFLNTFNTAHAFKNQSNKAIDAFASSKTFLNGSYSNMNDLITGDIAGVNLALFNWGQELILSGKAIDLASIDTYGNPENLLRTLYKNNAISKSVNLALLSAGFLADDITRIVTGTKPTVDQQKLLYGVFNIILGDDLKEALLPLNCQTPELTTLADLLNPKKLFPLSYKSLTVPVYNSTPGPTNSKTYYLLYENGQESGRILGQFGDRLQSLLSPEAAAACDAFSVSMMQIKNIKSMNIEKFSQVVRNLESVSDLPVNGTSIPTDSYIANTVTPLLAKGTGIGGRYSMVDFFGVMSGLPYDWKNLTNYIKKLETPELYSIYKNLFLAASKKRATVQVNYAGRLDAGITKYRILSVIVSDSGGGYDIAPTVTLSNNTILNTVIGTDSSAAEISNFGRVRQVVLVTDYGPETTTIPTGTVAEPSTVDVQSVIDQANTEILRIKTANSMLASQLNLLYNTFGKHLNCEQDARSLGLKQELFLTDLHTDISDLYSFMENLNQYATETETHESAQVLEAIANTYSMGGVSLIGGMREIRNAHRLGLTGAEQDNSLETEKLNLPPPTLTVPTKVDSNGNIVPLVSQGPLTNVPIITGAASTPGSLAGSPEIALMPDNLNIFNIANSIKNSIITPDIAVDEVISCNCDCWDSITE